ncbi:hypothetical protein BKA60DRAFT_665037 [Fusarium oxysporum]|nr:hypothetical protein BKA60DRAFT_665037 [Fusarium oxysporum]
MAFEARTAHPTLLWVLKRHLALWGRSARGWISDKQPTARGHATFHGCREENQHHPLDNHDPVLSIIVLPFLLQALLGIALLDLSNVCHHELEPCPPVQDYHQQQQQPQHPPQQQHAQQHPPPPLSPAHPTDYRYPLYGPRDPPVKRGRTEDGHQPNSTGHASEGMLSTPHHPPTSLPPPPPPGAYPDNPPRHMNYEGAPSVPLTLGGYHAPSFLPPTSVPHQTPYEQHGGYPSISHEPFYGVYPSSGPAKKKNNRASQACDSCRHLKAKCDEMKPCRTCKEKSVECKYREPVPKAADKAQAHILEGLGSVQTLLNSIMSHLGRHDQRLTNMESLLHQHIATLTPTTEPSADDEYKCAPASPCVAKSASVDQYYNDTDHDHPSSEPMPLRMMAEDEMEVEPGPPVPPGEPAIPINHTTLAGLLLEWPSIRELTKYHVEREGVRYISEYPISQEQNRGVLIVYGRGEDAHPSRQVREPTDHGNLDMADDSSNMVSPSPADDWGQLGGLSPPDQVEYKGDVLVDGNPDFSEPKVWTYVESFKGNILSMHPIIQPKLLDYWVRHFLDNLPALHPHPATSQTPKSNFAVAEGSQTSQAAGSKRKRSPGPDGSEPPIPAPPRTARPGRSIHTALVLTVLALGKVCLHGDNVPDVVHPTEPPSHDSPVTRNGAIPPRANRCSGPAYSSHSHSHSSGLPSPKAEAGENPDNCPSIRGVGASGAGHLPKKNCEVIPGLEYFAYATDILGNHTGAYNNMEDVYANIFAGLYHGQLGRPMESFAFIHRASHKLQVIMRPSLDKMRRIKRNNEFIQETKYNHLSLAFWTCLQLESDLIAEMPLPPSGLLSYEDDMPHPNMSLLEGFDQRILDSYPGQLYMRTHLNRIHRMFYAPEDPAKPCKDKFRNVDLVSDAVSGMDWVAPSFAFREDDPPADDILAARLRAKYWGAQVITYRPFIRQILQFSDSLKNHASSPNFPSVSSEFRQDITAPAIHPKARTHGDIDPQVVELAKKGITALIESTRAFHGLGDKRPIITNVFGTAHAQWGNLLILSAAFRDPILRTYVNEELLRTLFHKTIQFLRQSATATSALRTDMHILEGLQRDLFSYDPRTNSSFSIGTSVPGCHTPRPVPMAAQPPMPHQMGDQGHLRSMTHHLQMNLSHRQ